MIRNIVLGLLVINIVGVQAAEGGTLRSAGTAEQEMVWIKPTYSEEVIEVPKGLHNIPGIKTAKELYLSKNRIENIEGAVPQQCTITSH